MNNLENNSPALITAVKQVKNGKIQLEITELKETPSALSLLNVGNEKFSSSKGRKAWMTGMPEACKAEFPLLADAIDEAMEGAVYTRVPHDVKESLEGISSTMTSTHQGSDERIVLRVQVTESLQPIDTWQENNVLASIKKKTKEGPVLLFEEQPIFSLTQVVTATPTDTHIKHDS